MTWQLTWRQVLPSEGSTQAWPAAVVSRASQPNYCILSKHFLSGEIGSD